MALFTEFIGGSTPSVPRFVPIDINAEQLASVKANQSTLPSAQKLTTGVNTFNQAELERMLEQAIPGFDKMRSRVMANIQSQLEGELPTDVAESIQRGTAARSLMAGYAGTGMARNLTARDLGLTSFQLTQQGLDAATRWTTLSRQAFVAPMADVTSSFITPQQRLAFKVEERNAKFQRDYIANIAKAQGSLASQFQRFESTAIDIATSMAGSFMGGGGFGGGGGGGGATFSGAPNASTAF